MMKTAQLLHLIFSLLQCIGAQQTDPDYLPCGGDNFSCPRVNVTILECYNSSMLCDGDSFCSDVTDEGMTLNSLDCTGISTGTAPDPAFMCEPGLSVNITLLCNGFADCPSGDDETTLLCENKCRGPYRGGCEVLHRECLNSVFQVNCSICLPGYTDNPLDPGGVCLLSCSSDQFTCDNGVCIPASYECDTDNDCGDNSDEDHCGGSGFGCSFDQFTCDNGDCIPAFYECDAFDDCGDNSDEDHCETTAGCYFNDFTCDNGVCIPAYFECDTDNDCGDNSDEDHCGGSGSACYFDQFTCDNGVCIPAFYECDTYNDCGDNSDEDHCGGSGSECVVNFDHFTCDNGFCIPAFFECDAITDCEDNSDEDHCVMFGIVPATPSVMEGQLQTQVFILQTGGELRFDVIIDISVSGTATDGEDYMLLTSTVVFPPGGYIQPVDILLIDDPFYELMETIVVRATGSAQFSPETAVIYIIDTDLPAFRIISDTLYEVNEADGTAEVAVTVIGAVLTFDIEVTVNTTTGGSATEGNDYTPTTVVLTFIAGDGPGTTLNFSIPIVDDSLVEERENFNVELSSGEFSDTATFQIIDNDAAFVRFEVESAEVSEDERTIALCINVTGFSEEISYHFTLQINDIPDTAGTPSDYVHSVSTVAVNTPRQCFNVRITDDELYEEAEMFGIEAVIGPGDQLFPVIVSPDPVVISVLDNDFPNDGAVVTIIPSAVTVTENEGTVNVRILRVGNSTQAITLNFYTVQNSSAPGTPIGDDDYIPVSVNVTFDLGVVEQVVNISIIDDAILEGTEVFIGAIQLLDAPSNVDLQLNLTTITIVDNDNVTVRFSETQFTVAEDAGSITVTVEMIGESDIPIEVNVSTSPISATNALDYHLLNQAIVFEPGDQQNEVIIAILNDSVTEGTESFLLFISVTSGQEGILLGENSTMFISDNDAVTIQFDQEEYTVREDVGIFVVTVTKTGESEIPLEVTIDLIPIQATGTANFSQFSQYLSNGIADFFLINDTLEIPPGGDRSLDVTMVIVEDEVVESTEDFSLVLNNQSSVVLGNISRATVHVLEVNVIVVEFNATSYTVVEDNGFVNLTIVRRTPTTLNTVVNLNTNSGTAFSIIPQCMGLDSFRHIDFEFTSTEINIPPSNSSAEAVLFQVGIINDTVTEGKDEMFTAVLSSMSPDIVKVNTDAQLTTVTIQDDDILMVEFENATYVVKEGDGTLDVCLMKRGETALDFEVDISITETESAVGAEDGVDYLKGNTTHLPFLSNSAEICIAIEIVDDDLALEGIEGFSLMVNVSDPSIEVGGNATSVVTILDNDVVTVNFTSNSYSVAEGSGSVELCVQKDNKIVQILEVKVASQNASASGDGASGSGSLFPDFDLDTDVLAFTPGGDNILCIVISAADDDMREGQETFFFKLEISDDAVRLGQPSIAMLTIIEVTVEFTAETYTVQEDNETATVCLRTNFGILDPLIVMVTASTNTSSVTDFSLMEETLTFNSSSTGYVLCTQIIIVNDAIALEGLETIRIEFELPLNSVVKKGAFASSIITIVDDDVVTVEFVNSNYVVNEADGSLEVCLRKVGAVQTAQDFDVNITASPGQAKDGDDFTATTSQLIFPADEVSVCTRIELADDNILEPDEQFSLMFSVGNPDVQIGPIMTSTVTIIDDDKASTAATDGSTSNATIIGAVLGSVAGGLLILVVVAAVVLVKYRKRVKRKQTTESTDLPTNALQLQQLPAQSQVSLGGRYVGVTAPPKLARGSTLYVKPMTDAKLLIPGRHIQLLDAIGKGEFGIVYRSQLTGWEGMNEVVAVKTVRGGLLTPRDVDDMMRESIKMKDFNHPNVLSLIGVSIDAGESPYIVMPYMANGSLLSYLKKERPNLTIAVGADEDMVIDARKRLLSMCLQIAKGMEYLASQKVVHRDLAARNCIGHLE